MYIHLKFKLEKNKKKKKIKHISKRGSLIHKQAF